MNESYEEKSECVCGQNEKRNGVDLEAGLCGGRMFVESEKE